MIGTRELRADLAAHVRRAAAGEPTIIGINGQPAAVLTSHAGSGDVATAATMSSLIAAGAVVAPRRSDQRTAEGTVPVWGNLRLDRLLREIRG